MDNIWELCQKQTMVSPGHLTFLKNIIDGVNHDNIDGDIVECGVWKGGCSMWMAYCQKQHNMKRNILLYDTFEGMTYPSSDKDAVEARETFDKIANNLCRRDYDLWHDTNKWAYAPIELVKSNMLLVGYDQHHVSLVKGDVLETLDAKPPKSISIVRLDTDWYDSTKKEFDVLFPLVSIGGYIIVDDYWAWKGAKDATDEFLIENGHNVVKLDPNFTGNILVLKKIS
jgi:hypothetical protein